MPPVPKHFQYLVLGGGSGGIASARRAAEFSGVSVGLIEKGALGGTCVNVGCVPKKLMFNAAMHAEEIQDARDYGIDITVNSPFDWAGIKSKFLFSLESFQITLKIQTFNLLKRLL